MRFNEGSHEFRIQIERTFDLKVIEIVNRAPGSMELIQIAPFGASIRRGGQTFEFYFQHELRRLVFMKGTVGGLQVLEWNLGGTLVQSQEQAPGPTQAGE